MTSDLQFYRAGDFLRVLSSPPVDLANGRIQAIPLPEMELEQETMMIPQPTLQRISAAFPNVELKQTYGLSELGVLHSRSKDRQSLWLRVGLPSGRDLVSLSYALSATVTPDG